jgi:hypothetical protein
VGYPTPDIILTCAVCGFYQKTTNQNIANLIAAQHTAAYGPTHKVSTMSASVATIDLTAQSANVSPTQLYAVPANAGGMYRVSFYNVLTRAGTTSSTLPYGVIGFTDPDVNASENTGAIGNPNNTGNTLGLDNISNGYTDVAAFNAKGGTNITYSTSNYASVGATSMQYAVHLRLEYLG